MRKTVLLIQLLTLELLTLGQVRIQKENYYDLKPGVYEAKSVDRTLIDRTTQIVKPQTIYLDNDNVAFIKITQDTVALFDIVNERGDHKPVGLLTETSVIKVDTIFYNEIYKDNDQEWWLTFNVWYAIEVNDRNFYTDYKIHNNIAYQEELPQFSQKFLLVAQSTGYDEFYDNGYPEYFFVVILDEDNKIIFESSILEFSYGDEFWDVEFMNSVETEHTNKGFQFTIHGIEEDFNATWTGKRLLK